MAELESADAGNAGQGRVHVLNEVRQVVYGDAIIAHVGGDDVRGKRKKRVFRVLKFSHKTSS